MSSTMTPSCAGVAWTGIPVARPMSRRCMNGSRVRMTSKRNPRVHRSCTLPTVIGPGMVRLRMNAGILRRSRAAFGPAARIAVITSAGLRSAFLATCSAVRTSIMTVPVFFAPFWAAICWRARAGSVAVICAMPSMWPATARTSHPGQSVGSTHWLGVTLSSSTTARLYSVAADVIAVPRSRTAARGGPVDFSAGSVVMVLSLRSLCLGRDAQVVSEHVDGPVKQPAPAVPAGVVGKLGVDQAADNRYAQVDVGLPGHVLHGKRGTQDLERGHCRRIFLRDQIEAHYPAR